MILSVFGTTQRKIFADVDWVIEEAVTQGKYIALLLTWGHSIFAFFSPDEPVIFNEKNTYTYGRAIGSHYKDYANIV
ncbi:MAG TPA: DUF4038 domain-containing protein [Sphingobacterium sp.]|nr:DUF4038 domain-containing protein [Sphingobacterium sp.]